MTACVCPFCALNFSSTGPNERPKVDHHSKDGWSARITHPLSPPPPPLSAMTDTLQMGQAATQLHLAHPSSSARTNPNPTEPNLSRGPPGGCHLRPCLCTSNARDRCALRATDVARRNHHMTVVCPACLSVCLFICFVFDLSVFAVYRERESLKTHVATGVGQRRPPERAVAAVTPSSSTSERELCTL